MNTIIHLASWEAYDLKKCQVKEDPAVFCPEQLWEFNYLLDSITNTHPTLDPIMVMLAIRQATRNTVAPRPRKYFVQVVMDSIKERQLQWAQLLSDSNQDAA
jgi:hypothetical protein